MKLTLFTLDEREKKQMDFDWNCLLGKYQPSQLVIHHAVRDAKLDAQEKLFVLTTFSSL